jgi:nicotinamide mononucleotide transporter
MDITTWITEHWLEIFGAAAGIIYVFLEIRQNIWLWPVGIITSAVYIIVFFTSKFYADMSLQVYYVVISFYGFYVWRFGTKATAATPHNSSAIAGDTPKSVPLEVSRTPRTLIIRLAAIYLLLHAGMWYVLANFTDSPVAFWDSFTTALSVVATWMLARKYIEHWILWVIVNIVSLILYLYKGLYPTSILFLVYTVMAMVGYREWLGDIKIRGRIG